MCARVGRADRSDAGSPASAGGGSHRAPGDPEQAGQRSRSTKWPAGPPTDVARLDEQGYRVIAKAHSPHIAHCLQAEAELRWEKISKNGIIAATIRTELGDCPYPLRLFACKQWWGDDRPALGSALAVTPDLTAADWPARAVGVLYQGPSLMENLRPQAERFGVELRDCNVTAVDFSHRPFTIVAGDETGPADAVILATETSALWLDVAGVFVAGGVRDNRYRQAITARAMAQRLKSTRNGGWRRPRRTQQTVHRYARPQNGH